MAKENWASCEGRQGAFGKWEVEGEDVCWESPAWVLSWGFLTQPRKGNLTLVSVTDLAGQDFSRTPCTKD